MKIAFLPRLRPKENSKEIAECYETQIRHTRVMNLLGSVYDNDDRGSRDGDIKRIYSPECFLSFCLSPRHPAV